MSWFRSCATRGCSTAARPGSAGTPASGSSATSSTAGPTGSVRSTSSGGSSGRAEGAVRCLLGNHEALLLAVHRFGDEETSFPGTSFRDVWRANGGVESDLRALTDGARRVDHLPSGAGAGGRRPPRPRGHRCVSRARKQHRRRLWGDLDSPRERRGRRGGRGARGAERPHAVARDGASRRAPRPLRRIADRARPHADRVRPRCRPARGHRTARLRERPRDERRPLPLRGRPRLRLPARRSSRLGT